MTKDLTHGSPMRVILLFTFPLVLGNLFQQFYSQGVQAAAVAFLCYGTYLLSLLVARHEETGIENTGMAFFAAVYPTLLLVLLSFTNHLTAAAALEKYSFINCIVSESCLLSSSKI